MNIQTAKFSFDPDVAPQGGAAVITPPASGSATPEGGGSAATPSGGADSGAAASPATPEPWNGEVEHLAKRPWWDKLPEADRKVIQGDLETGIKAKTSNFNKGVETERAKLKTLEERAAKAEKERDEATATKEFLDRILGEDDHTAALKKETEGLRAALAEKDAVAKKTLEDKEKEWTPWKERAEKAEAELIDTRVKAQAARYTSEYPDIYKDFKPVTPEEAKAGKVPTGMFVDFVRLLEAGVSEEKAAVAVRAMNGAPAVAAKPGRNVTVDPAVKLASRGDGRAAALTHEPNMEELDFDAAASHLKKGKYRGEIEKDQNAD